MLIRKMIIEDYGSVYQLWMTCSGMGLNNLDDSREGILRFLERNPETCFVAETDQIVGVILAGNDGRRGYIYHTAVHHDYRNRGIATDLVKSVERAMKSLNINKIALVAFERNESGNSFWEKQGYSLRTDLSYRNKSLTDMIRIDT